MIIINRHIGKRLIQASINKQFRFERYRCPLFGFYRIGFLTIRFTIP